MSNESITITQSINSVTVAAGGSVGLNAGGLIQGNLEVDGNVVIDGLLTVGADTDGKDVRFWGETANKYTLWDASQDKLIITGDLQVDGTTTTINSTVVTIEDPVFTLGGATAPTTSDSKDRGIEFHYYDTDASAGKTGFFGWGNSDNAIKFLLNCADPSGSEIFTGDLAEVHTGPLVAAGTIETTNAAGGQILDEAATATNPTIVPNKADPDVGLGWSSTNKGALVAGGSTVLTFNNSQIFPHYHIGKQLTSAPLMEVYAATSTVPGFTFWGDTDTGLGWGAANALSLITGGASRLYIDSSGNVGIGTSSPSAIFHVQGGGGSLLQIGDATNPYGSALGYNVAASASTVLTMGWAGSALSRFLYLDGGTSTVSGGPVLLELEADTGQTADLLQVTSAGGTSGDLVVIDGSGNVGIGTSSPDSAVEIVATGSHPGGYTDNLKLTAANYPSLLFKRTSDDKGFQIGRDNSSLHFQSEDAGTVLTRMTIKETGKVGIGTTIPASELEVDGTITVAQGTAGTGGTGSIVNGSFNDFGLNFTGNNKLQTYRGTEVLTETGQTGALGYLAIASGSLLGFSSGTAGGSQGDVTLSRIEAGVVGVGTGALAEVDGELRCQNMEMDRTTVDAPFINYKASADGDATSAISTLTVSGATTHHIQVDINGTKAWIAVSTNDPSH